MATLENEESTTKTLDNDRPILSDTSLKTETKPTATLSGFALEQYRELAINRFTHESIVLPCREVEQNVWFKVNKMNRVHSSDGPGLIV